MNPSRSVHTSMGKKKGKRNKKWTWKINTNVICEVLCFCCAFSKRNNFQVQPFCHAHEYIYTYSLNFIVALTLACTFDIHTMWNSLLVTIGNEITFLEDIFHPLCMCTLNNQPDGFIPFLKNRISFESFSFIIKIHGIDGMEGEKKARWRMEVGSTLKIYLNVFVIILCVIFISFMSEWFTQLQNFQY